MEGNSKSELLAKLAEGDAMHGWGALLALGRDTANELLQATFLSTFRQQDFIVPISGEYYADAQCTEHVVFDGLMVGPPRLSFEKASGRSARVIVSMELIAGRCSARESFPGKARSLRRSHELSQGLGYALEVTTDLVVLPVRGSDDLQLAIDLTKVSAPTCNLAVTDSAARRMGEFILDELRLQPGFNRVLGFVRITPNINSSVFGIQAAAPLAQGAPQGSGSPGDGAVLLLLKLRGTDAGTSLPDAAPYLLPRKDEGGGGNVAASLLVGKIREPHSPEPAKALLSQVILPEGLVLSMDEEHAPYDKIFFGELVPGDGSRRISPGLTSTGAGGTVAYSTHGGSLYNWQALEINYPRAAGTISDQGLYNTRPVGQLAAGQRIVAVSAKVSQQPDASMRSALVVESSEPLTISPRVVIWYPGYEDVSFTCSGEGTPRWSLLGDAMGRLQADPEDPRKATFKPDDARTPLVRLQRVEVSAGAHKGHATVVILASDPKLNIEPYYTPDLSPLATLDFALDDDVEGRWQLFGDGAIDDSTGRYTAPAQATGEASVVAAFAGPFAGVAIIEHQAGATAEAMYLQERWRELKSFNLTLNNERRNKVFANGYQQVGIDIEIATQSFTNSNGETVWDPVSDLELSTLVLLDASGNKVPYLLEEQVGIPERDYPLWMASKRRNHFDYYPTPTAVARVVSEEEGKRRVTVYVHSRAAETAYFSAEFQDHNRGWRRSTDKDENKGKIQIEGVQVPAPNLSAYRWSENGGKRVAASKGFDYDGDTINYWQFTTYYWELSGEGIQFVNVVFDSISMLKWESEQYEETFCTYTGVAFKPRRPEDAPKLSTSVQYQAELQLLSREASINYSQLDYNFKGQEDVTAGTLLVTLDRVPNFKYWKDVSNPEYRNVLRQAMKLTLTDNYGNLHKIRILFGAGGSGRSVLELKLQ